MVVGNLGRAVGISIALVLNEALGDPDSLVDSFGLSAQLSAASLFESQLRSEAPGQGTLALGQAMIAQDAPKRYPFEASFGLGMLTGGEINVDNGVDEDLDIDA